MIFDRTLQDVNNAIEIRNQKVQKGLSLTEEDIETLERGTLTIVTLNRIEDRQRELKNIFNDIGYWNVPITNKIWDYTQIFDEIEFERILNNTNILKNAFFVYAETPNTPSVSYHYEDINSLEKILFDLDVMINDVKSNYRICGTFEAGEDI